MLSSVDLPQPDGPTTATISWASTVNVTPASASTAWPRAIAVGVADVPDEDPHGRRRRKRWTLPVAVRGRSATNSTAPGTL